MCMTGWLGGISDAAQATRVAASLTPNACSTFKKVPNSGSPVSLRARYHDARSRDLMEQDALVRQGERKHTRYALNIPLRVQRILIEKSGEIVASVRSS